MDETPGIFVGGGEVPQHLLLKRANRHGLIAGATGTGKTVTLQILAEGFSDQGVPVFVADVKGDLSGISQAGDPAPKLKGKLLERAENIGFKGYAFAAYPTVFWDLFGEKGHPLRTTVSEMGPLLLSRLLALNDTQEGVLSVAFQVADDEGMLVLDLKDLRSLLNFVGENAKALTTQYGNVSKASVGAIQHGLLTLERQGGELFFGEPALELADFMRQTPDGRGMINVLAADKLMQTPKLYATFLLWLLAELFEELPEVGDAEKPRLVFFFDEAHLLFEDAPKALIDKVEQVVRLIRSKGVGVYFVSQSPLDVPEDILGQLGNRVQHALRAFTPRDRKTVRAAAETFRPNPAFEAAEVITVLGVGEALVSTLGRKGAPGIVERTLIRPPSSRMGPASSSERRAVLADSPVRDRYEEAVDRESAYEMLHARAERATKQAERAAAAEAKQTAAAKAEREAAKRRTPSSSSRSRSSSSRSRRQSPTEALVTSAARSIGTQLGRSLLRGILGSLLKGR
jgi:DNA helicase HerA-like ATPase